MSPSKTPKGGKKPRPKTKLGESTPWQRRRDRHRAWLELQPNTGIGPDEVEAHFTGMPAHYWEQVNESDLLWGLETIHGFLNLLATAKVPATTPYVNWRQLSETGRTLVMLCTWDRQGLLAKAAAAFSAVRLNILQADIFTRADNIVLDLFCVTDADSLASAKPERLQEMTFLLEGSLSKPPRFASVWACLRHKYVVPAGDFPVRVSIDNQSSAVSTIVQVEAADRLGLLYDILQTIAESGLNLTQANILTDDVRARDSLHVTDANGRKVLDPDRLESLRRKLEEALIIKPEQLP